MNVGFLVAFTFFFSKILKIWKYLSGIKEHLRTEVILLINPPDLAYCSFMFLNVTDTKQWLCECNPCRGGQVCQDQLDPRERICLGKPGPYGSQYTLTFSNDAVTGGRYKVIPSAKFSLLQGFI